MRQLMAPAQVDDLTQIIADNVRSLRTDRHIAVDFVEEQDGSGQAQGDDHLEQTAHHREAVRSRNLFIDAAIAQFDRIGHVFA